MINLTLYTTSSEPEEINKSLANDSNFTGSFRGEVSVLHPVILIEHEIPVAFNYARIPSFDRYYYVDDIVSIRTNIWELHLRVDVLMSHRQGILNSMGVVADTESAAEDLYSPGSQWQTKVKKKTDIIPFSGGFSTTPYFILITAGGVVS